MPPKESHDDRTQSFVALTAGTVVSHYKIIEKIGAGGMGEVYLAEDMELDRKVALKFLPAYLCQDEDCRKRFKREAQAAAKLNHPSIITIFEVSEHQGRPFFAMEHVEGRSLKEFPSDRDLPVERVLELGVQICEGLLAAHEKGVIHRDIKPSNILIDSHGRARIVDFGLASVVGTDRLTKTGSTLGTIGYMSPEQVEGEDIDQRSDLFSLGVILYELITKQNPFLRDSEAATLKAVCEDIAEPLARYKRDVPDLLESITTKLLEKNPAHRYQSAAGAASDLQRLKKDSGSTVSSRVVTKSSKRPLRLVLPVLLVVIAAALLILKPWRLEIGPSQGAYAEENKLAIMYFDNVADPADSLRLGEIVTSLLITDLTESEFVNVVSSQRLYDILKQLGHEGERRIDRTIATQIAEKAKARWMLVGNILNMEPEIIITAQLIDVGTGNTSASQRIEGAAGERVFSLVDRLTVEVKQDLALPSGATQEADPEVAEITTHSPEAYRYYLEGRDLFYKHFWGEAKDNFLEAIKIDSTFTMAHLYLAQIGYWQNDSRARMYIADAMNYADRVSQREKYFINSLDARINGDIPRAIENLHKILERYPEDKDTYVSLGLIIKYETGELEEAVAYFKKAIELDPFHREALNQLAYAYCLLGDFEKAMWAVNKYVEIAPDEANPYDSRGEILAMNGKLDEAIESYEKATALKPGFGRSNLANLYMFQGDFEKADGIYRAMAFDANERTRADGRLALTRIPRYQGKFQEALRLLGEGIEIDRRELGECPEIAEKLWMRVMINEFLSDDRTVIEDLKQAVSIMEEHEARNLYSGLYRAYLAAKLAESGDQAGADSLMYDITTAISESGYPDSADYLLASAFIAFELQKYDAAAVYWEKVIKPVPYHSPSLLFLGMSYIGAGRLGNAVPTLEKAINIYDDSRIGCPGLGVLGYYLLGKAYEASGWTDRAISQYETFLEIWKNADPGIAEVEDAKTRLARLRNKP